MGQAKRRGSFEDRKRQALDRMTEKQAKLKTLRKPYPPKISKLALIAAALSTYDYKDK